METRRRGGRWLAGPRFMVSWIVAQAGLPGCSVAWRVLAMFVVGACRGAGYGPAPVGETDATDVETTAAPEAEDSPVEREPAETTTPGLRRLTRHELDNVLRDLLLDTSRPASRRLPEDAKAPFDNDHSLQLVTQPHVHGIESLAADVAHRLLLDHERLWAVLGCTPASAMDEVCLRGFVERFGRLALRRTLDPAEVDGFVALGLEFAERGDDPGGGIEVVLRAFLQDAEFVYRMELGVPVADEPGVFQLRGGEVASRLSFFLWGSTPDDALLDAADAGDLDHAAGVVDAARRMLDDERAHAQIDHFHALWFGYATLAHPPALTDALRAETAALIDRVLFEDKAPWAELFTAEQTYVDAMLAEHYGLAIPDQGSDWIDYGDSGRMGILAHGSFLSASAGVGDTSPTRRGRRIREHLLCEPIPPPPPDAAADSPPENGTATCKIDRYLAHAQGACATCHSTMDPIGFGLENYDRAGRFREHDEGEPTCPIDGRGVIDGQEFEGPAGLATLLLEGERLEPCLARQLYRFALGREIDERDANIEAAIDALLTTGGLRFDDLVLAIVGHEAFRQRREKVVGQ